MDTDCLESWLFANLEPGSRIPIAATMVRKQRNSKGDGYSMDCYSFPPGRPVFLVTVFAKQHQVHFMVTQGMRDRKTLKTKYPWPVDEKKMHKSGEVNPAAIQLDFILRSPTEDKNIGNNPPREVVLHFFAMEVTWK